MGEALGRLMEFRDDPYAPARSWKERTGGTVIGYFCCYAPEEIIHAAGALPVRITGENRQILKSGAHLQSYCCSLARTGLDMALTGGLDFLDGTVFTHTCDTMMRLSDIWRLNAGFAFHGDVVIPVRLEGKAALDYLYTEVARFKEAVEGYLGPISEGALQESIELYNRNRELLRELYGMRRENPTMLPSDQALWLVASSSLMEKREHNELLEKAIQEIKAEGASAGEGKVPLFVVGSVMDQWEFLKMVEEVGATVVDDDLCTGYRYFDEAAPEDPDPVMSLTRRIADRASCPCKYRPSTQRAGYLVDRVAGSGARGVIFFQFKFCDPHAFDYPYLKDALDAEGIPSLLLEIEHGSVSAEQLRTRVEALLETIRG